MHGTTRSRQSRSGRSEPQRNLHRRPLPLPRSPHEGVLRWWGLLSLLFSIKRLNSVICGSSFVWILSQVFNQFLDVPWVSTWLLTDPLLTVLKSYHYILFLSRCYMHGRLVTSCKDSVKNPTSLPPLKTKTRSVQNKLANVVCRRFATSHCHSWKTKQGAFKTS